MFEYKVMKAKNEKEAEEIMNLLARDGWRVVSTTVLTSVLSINLIITFERKKD